VDDGPWSLTLCAGTIATHWIRRGSDQHDLNAGRAELPFVERPGTREG
jgi:hypothetical protein